MGRGRRFNNEKPRSSFKYLLYTSVGTLIIIAITFIVTFIVYNNKVKDSAYKSLKTEKIADLVPNENTNSQTETASTEIGKTVEDVIKQTQNEVENKIQQSNNSLADTTTSNTKSNNTQVAEEKEEEPQVVQEVIKDPEFSLPVEGEITNGYAKDNLIYSNTLEEWVTHLGIDIKADRTTIVKASEKGTVVAIKNDPRYGLTVIIEHTNGYKSVYSNLLTAEFVSEGEEVQKGQTIGTVGNSAAFEIADEPHLHFEILKDNENVDPSAYIK